MSRGWSGWWGNVEARVVRASATEGRSCDLREGEGEGGGGGRAPGPRGRRHRGGPCYYYDIIIIINNNNNNNCYNYHRAWPSWSAPPKRAGARHGIGRLFEGKGCENASSRKLRRALRPDLAILSNSVTWWEGWWALDERRVMGGGHWMNDG